MVLIPLAVAGYVIYRKKKAEREAREGKAEEGGNSGSRSDEDGDLDGKKAGPMSKFRTFCQTIEKERREAEHRRLKEFVNEAMKTSALKKAAEGQHAEKTTPDTMGAQKRVSQIPNDTTQHDATTLKEISNSSDADLLLNVSKDHEVNDFEVVPKKQMSAPCLLADISLQPLLSKQTLTSVGSMRMNRPRIATE